MKKSSYALIMITSLILLAVAPVNAQQIGDPPRVEIDYDAKLSPLKQLTTGNWNRQQVINWYNAEYQGSIPAMNWTGNTNNCTAGDVAAAYRNATLKRINYYRKMAGVFDQVVFNDAVLNAKCQEAALMMSAEGDLSHSPGTGWACYSADGADAAGHSNLAWGRAGAGAIDLYIDDNGVINAGHRRWILYPRQRLMASGSVNGSPVANALWVFGAGSGGHAGDDQHTSWPPAGYVPGAIVYPMWSFSFPGADFTNATVSIMGPTGSITTTIHPVSNGFGTNTIAWQTSGIQKPNNAPDITYKVTVSNVIVGGSPMDYSYDVVIIDPDFAVASGGEGEGEVSAEGEGNINNPDTPEPTLLNPANAQQLLNSFGNYDTDNSGGLSQAEITTVLNASDFGLLDSDNDSFVTMAEIQAFIDTNSGNMGCSCSPSKELLSPVEELKKRIDDLFIFALSALVLLAGRRWFSV